MAANTSIADNGGSIRLSVGTLVRNISKVQIAEVTIVKSSLIKIDLGTGPLGNIYIDYADVFSPLTASPSALRDAILSMLISGVGGGSGSGDATQSNQVIEINLLNSLVNSLVSLTEKINTISDNQITLASNLGLVNTKVDSLGIELVSLASNQDSANTKLNSLSAKADTINSELVAVANNVNTNTTNINSLSSTIAEMSLSFADMAAKVNTVNLNVATVYAEQLSLDAKVDTLLSNLNGVNTNIAAINTSINNIDTSLNSLNVSVSKLDERFISGPLLIDKSLGDTFYYGYAVPGALDSANVWAIEKVVIAGDGSEVRTWANNTKTFINRWTQRLTLSYGFVG